MTPLLVTLLCCLCLGARGHGGDYTDTGSYSDGHGSDGHHTGDYGSGGYSSGSGRHPGGYPSGPSSSYYPSYRNFLLPVKPDKELTEVDKLFAELAGIDNEIHILLEEVTATQGGMVLVKKLFDNFKQLLDKAQDTEAEQDNELNQLDTDLADLEHDLSTTQGSLDTTGTTNSDNTHDLMTEGARLALAESDNAEQQRDLDSLAARLPTLKDKLLYNVQTCFQLADAEADILSSRLDTLNRRIHVRQCETGTVTLRNDDRRATVIFQTDFGGDVPQVLFGIAGYESDLKALDKSRDSAFGGFRRLFGNFHGYGDPKVPNAIGLFVSATPSPDGIEFQVTNLGFGETDLLVVKVNYQACNIGPSADDMSRLRNKANNLASNVRSFFPEP